MKSEIEFLVELVKNENISKKIRDLVLNRIVEVSKTYQVATSGVATISNIPTAFTPTVFTTADTCLHEYPSDWNSVIPPNCKKCGKSAFPNYNVTCSNNYE